MRRHARMRIHAAGRSLVGEASEGWARAPWFVRLSVVGLGLGLVALALVEDLWVAGFVAGASLAALVLAVALVDRAHRRWLVGMLVVALATRWLVAGGLEAILVARGIGFAFPDEMAYDRVAEALRRSWFDGVAVPAGDRYLATTFTTVIGATYTLAGHEALAARALNAALAVVTAGIVLRLAALVGGTTAGRAPRIAAALAAFYPTTFGWSVLLLKDTSLILATTAALLAWLSLARGPRLGALAVLPAALWWIADNRGAQAAVVLAALAIAALFSVVRGSRRLALTAATAVTLVAMVAALVLVPSVAIRLDQVPDRLAGERALQAQQARTAIVDDAPAVEASTRTAASSWPETLAYVPGGLASVLLGPFPWDVRNLSQGIGAAFSLLSVVFCLLALVGAQALWRADRRTPLLHLGAVIVSFWVLLALTAGNTGTAFRHRDAVFALVLVLAAEGIVRLSHRPVTAGEQRLRAESKPGSAPQRRPGPATGSRTSGPVSEDA